MDHRNFILHYGDMTDSTNLIRLIKETNRMKFIILAMSHVAVSLKHLNIPVMLMDWEPVF
jgi:GDPmannose 4,6-dehydratase